MSSETSYESRTVDSDPDTKREVPQTHHERDRARAGSASLLTVGYRGGAVLLFVIAVVSGGAASFYPSASEVLAALAGVGVVGAVLCMVLSSGVRHPVEVSQSLYEATADNRAAIVDHFAVTGHRTYVPTGERPVDARFYVGGTMDQPVPSAENLDSVVVDSDRRQALSLVPTGRGLVRDFEPSVADLPEEDRAVVQALLEGVTDYYELAESTGLERIADLDVAERRRVTVRVRGGTVGDLGRLDHPIQSFIGVGLAVATGAPVESESTVKEGTAYLSFEWNTNGDASRATE
jgi:hypothetical protein